MTDLVDIIDSDGNVIDVVSRDKSHGKLLRWVHVYLFDTDGNWVLQQRAEHKSFRPNLIECAAGGMVTAGEAFEDAAHRELKEELGLDVPLAFVCESWGDYGQCYVFKGTLTGEMPKGNPDEVGHVFSLKEEVLETLFREVPWVLMRGFRESYTVYKQRKQKGEIHE